MSMGDRATLLTKSKELQPLVPIWVLPEKSNFFQKHFATINFYWYERNTNTSTSGKIAECEAGNPHKVAPIRATEAIVLRRKPPALHFRGYLEGSDHTSNS
jgi:hypothetical protein